MPRNPHKTRCSVPGCRAWARRGSQPPLCSAHAGDRVGAPPGNQNRRIHGFYATTLHPQELSDLATCASATTLDAEIAITRVALRRIFGMLLTGLTPGPNPRPLDAHDYARFVGLAFQGAGAISRLLRARHALSPGDPGEVHVPMGAILDQLSKDWSIEL